MLSGNNHDHLDKILSASSPPADPLLQAIFTAWKKKKIKGEWYQAKETLKTESFSFAFLGVRGKPELEPKNLWLMKCRVCGNKFPALIIQKTYYSKEIVPGRWERKRKTERLSSLLTVEGGQMYLDGFLQLPDLVKRGNHED